MDKAQEQSRRSWPQGGSRSFGNPRLPESVHRGGNPRGPGEEADLLGQSAELRAGVRAGAARGEEAEATVLGCLAPPAVLSPSQAFLVCSVDRGFTATAPWGVKGDTVSALQAVREASAAWGGVGPGREGGWGASSFHQGELFPSHRGPHRAQGISQDYA